MKIRNASSNNKIEKSDFKPTSTAIIYWYGKHLRGDKKATDLLTRWGCLQADNADQQADKNEASGKTINVDIPSSIVMPNQGEVPFDFSFFAVTSKQILSSNIRENWLPEHGFRAACDSPQSANSGFLPLEADKKVVTKILQALKNSDLGDELDLRHLSESVAKSESIEYLPYQKDNKTPQTVYVYIDIASFEQGYKQDALALQKVLEKSQSHIEFKFIHIITRGTTHWRYSGQELPTSSKNKPIPLPSGMSSQALVVAQYADSTLQRNHRLIRQLQNKLGEVLWLSVAKIPDNLPFAIRWVSWGRQAALPEDTVNELVALFQSVRLIDDKLLRQVVQAFGLPAVCEQAFWQHSMTQYNSGQGIVSVSSKAEQAELHQLAAAISTEKVRRFTDIVQGYVTNISQSFLHEHRILLSAIAPQYVSKGLPESIDFFTSMAANIDKEEQDTEGNASFLQETIEQTRGFISSTPVAVQKTLALANLYQYREGKVADIENELAMDVLKESADDPQVTRVEINQKDNHLFVQWDGESNPFINAHQPVLLASIEAGHPGMVVAEYSSSNTVVLDQINTVPEWVTDFKLTTQHQSVSLKKCKSDDFWWATSLAVTSGGGIAEAEHIKVIWPKEPGSAFEFARWGVRTGGPNSGSAGGMMCFTDSTPMWFHSQRPELDATGLVNKLQVNGVEFNLRYIPPGSFLMGSPQDEPERLNSETLHPVTLTQGFWMGETTVTQQLWQAVMGDNPSHFQAQDNEELPVEQVSWHDCQTFCEKLSELTGAKFSLPTEAQWEYACRAGTTAPFNTGEQLGYEQGNYDINYPYEGREALVLQSGEKYKQKTVDVRKFKANRWGLKQMHGNVFEWCQDDWREAISGHQVDPCATGDTAADAVLRGGSWYFSGRCCRSAFRFHFRRDFRINYVGLRVTQVMPGTSQKKQEQVLTESASENV